MLLEAVLRMENVPKNAREGEQRMADACLAQLRTAVRENDSPESGRSTDSVCGAEAWRDPPRDSQQLQSDSVNWLDCTPLSTYKDIMPHRCHGCQHTNQLVNKRRANQR
ncbi:hypothetical protein E1301_Tti010860 [Triplophysa tibetana]|uniref:Uncharacterized protein n=1 Tax=Triplophysa tibetana TaxID=1572043 RepID=A0A5A9MZ66_9TELE|nr:hypothetical protein E1301_Tti010860 [Triplophysa tibetana]